METITTAVRTFNWAFSIIKEGWESITNQLKETGKMLQVSKVTTKAMSFEGIDNTKFELVGLQYNKERDTMQIVYTYPLVSQEDKLSRTWQEAKDIELFDTNLQPHAFNPCVADIILLMQDIDRYGYRLVDPLTE